MITDVLLAFIDWGYEHWWFFGWTAFWGILLTIQLAGSIIKLLLFTIPNRILRTLKVFTHGWPPEGLDADGDLKKNINMTMNDEALGKFKIEVTKNVIKELTTRKG